MLRESPLFSALQRSGARALTHQLGLADRHSHSPKYLVFVELPPALNDKRRWGRTREDVVEEVPRGARAEV